MQRASGWWYWVEKSKDGVKCISSPWKRKRNQTDIFCWITFSLWWWHAFSMASFRWAYAILQHLFLSRVAWLFCQDIYRLLHHVTPQLLYKLKMWTLWCPVHLWKWSLSLVNPGITMLAMCLCQNRRKKINWWKNLAIQVFSITLLTVDLQSHERSSRAQCMCSF